MAIEGHLNSIWSGVGGAPHRHTPDCGVNYNIDEWAKAMIKGHTALVKKSGHHEYFCKHCCIKKQIVLLNLHQWAGCNVYINIKVEQF